VEKETRATAISFGHPIAVNRSHPDYPALYLARTWLGEHRSSTSHLYQRIRELRGMNYGDYAYIEAFPRGCSVLRTKIPGARLFEIWIRPVPENADGGSAYDSTADRERPRRPTEATALLTKNVGRPRPRPAARLRATRSGTGSEFTAYMHGSSRPTPPTETPAAVRRSRRSDLRVVIVTGREGLAEDGRRTWHPLTPRSPGGVSR
jgi:hypothetical protein